MVTWKPISIEVINVFIASLNQLCTFIHELFIPTNIFGYSLVPKQLYFETKRRRKIGYLNLFKYTWSNIFICPNNHRIFSVPIYLDINFWEIFSYKYIQTIIWELFLRKNIKDIHLSQKDICYTLHWSERPLPPF